MAKTVCSPLERLRIIAQTGVLEGGNRQTAKHIFKTEGLRGFWRGNLTDCIRSFPAKSILFASNDYWRATFHKSLNLKKNQRLPPSMSFLSGSLSGVVAVTCTYPLTLIRTRLISQTHHQHTTFFALAARTARKEGFLAFYKVTYLLTNTVL